MLFPPRGGRSFRQPRRYVLLTIRLNVMTDRFLAPRDGITARSWTKDSMRRGLTAGKSPKIDGVMRETGNVLCIIFSWNVPHMIMTSPGNSGSTPRTPPCFCFSFLMARFLWYQRFAKSVPILGEKTNAPGESKLTLAIKALGSISSFASVCQGIY